jgi:hypothetical protein
MQKDVVIMTFIPFRKNNSRQMFYNNLGKVRKLPLLTHSNVATVLLYTIGLAPFFL